MWFTFNPFLNLHVKENSLVLCFTSVKCNATANRELPINPVILLFSLTHCCRLLLSLLCFSWQWVSVLAWRCFRSSWRSFSPETWWSSAMAAATAEGRELEAQWWLWKSASLTSKMLRLRFSIEFMISLEMAFPFISSARIRLIQEKD